MARPRSKEKRNAILDAAIRVFAERGVWSTPTSAISRAASVAEGTLFTYFPTKELLVNELYRALKLELAEVLLSTFPRDATVRGKFQHIWEQYIQWGLASPDKRKVLAQLNVSDQIAADMRAVGYEPFAELEQAAAESVRQRQIGDYPLPFIAALLNTQAEVTMAFMARQSNAEIDYCAVGFEVFWKGIATS